MSIRPGTGSECGGDCFGDECMESMGRGGTLQSIMLVGWD